MGYIATLDTLYASPVANQGTCSVSKGMGSSLRDTMRASDPSVFPFEIEGLPASPEQVVSVLRDQVTEARYQRIVAVARARTLGVVPVLDNLADPHNASAILRSCDAFGVHEVHVVATTAGSSGHTR